MNIDNLNFISNRIYLLSYSQSITFIFDHISISKYHFIKIKSIAQFFSFVCTWLSFLCSWDWEEQRVRQFGDPCLKQRSYLLFSIDLIFYLCDELIVPCWVKFITIVGVEENGEKFLYIFIRNNREISEFISIINLSLKLTNKKAMKRPFILFLLWFFFHLFVFLYSHYLIIFLWRLFFYHFRLRRLL